MPGQIHRLKSLLHALALYVEARGKLLQIEAQEAASKSVGGVVLAAIMAACVFCGWLLAAPALVWLVAKSQGWHWTYVALGAAGVHLGLAFVCFLVLKAKLRRFKAFEETFQQFQRDREWLSNSTNSD
ncbi:MAG: phage holin family protein [Prosthecobacter sp.]|nr:phage holin family protein [Prosthecobacter sp.]